MHLAFFTSLLSLVISLPRSHVELTRLVDLDPQEVAVKGEISISQSVTKEKFRSCVPRESIAFPSTLPANLSSKIFEKKELSDWLQCSPTKCAFNFRPQELKELENAKTEESRKNKFFEFYKNRVDGKTPALDTSNVTLLIRSKSDPFEDCASSPEFKKLLDERPVKGWNYRFSVVKYRDNMRPTARLLQGVFSEPKPKTFCYTEALLFSDHYDSDRIEVWSLLQSDTPSESSPSKLRLQIRHRVDLLNTWVRRINKPAFVNPLNETIDAQLVEAAACLNK